MERLGMGVSKRRLALAGAETIYYTVARSAFRPGESYYALREGDG
jgi:hypothetical protein